MLNQKLELFEFKGIKVLFTPARERFLKEPAPSDLYRYEMRHSDEGFEPCELAKGIIVNFYGTIFSKEKIFLGEDGYLIFDEDIDFIDLNEIMTFDEYLDLMNDPEHKQCPFNDDMKMSM